MAVAKQAVGKREARDDAGTLDPALKKRWQKTIARYLAAVADESSGWDERYEALDEILHSDPPLYLGGGFRSAAKFLAAHAPGQSARSIDAAILVARHFEPAAEAKYGVSKLELLVRYLEARGGVPLGPAKIDLEAQKLRVPSKAGALRVPFADATVLQLRAATRAAVSTPSTARVEPAAVKKVRAALAKAGFKDIAVSMRGGKLALSGIAPERIGKVGKAISLVKG